MIRFIQNFVKRMFQQMFKGKKHIKLGLYGPPNAGKCVTPETGIVFYDGKIRTIRDVFQEVMKKDNQIKNLNDFKEVCIDSKNLNLIVPSFDIKNLNITPKKISYVYAQKYTGDIYTIQTRNGRRLRVTPNHPLIRISDNGVEKVRSAELKIGESVAIAKKLALNSSIMIPEITENFNIYNNGTIQSLAKFHNLKEITTPTYINEELVSFVAYTIAESYHTKNRIKFSNLDKNLLAHFRYITNKLFNLDLIHRINKGVPELEINSKTLTDYLKEVFGFKPSKSGEKEIPSQFMGLPDNLTANLLRTLYDCEGYVPKDFKIRGAEIEFSSKSKKLVEQVQLLLNRFGIVGRFKEKLVNNIPYYRLLIGGSDNHRLFKEKIGFTIKHKVERLNELCKAGLKRNKFSLPIVNLLDTIRKKQGLTQKEFFLDNKHISRMKKTNKITYHRLANMAKNLLKINFIRKLANSDALWDEIISIKKEPYNDYVYDLTIEDTHTFLTSSGLIAHNTTLANRICKDWLGEKMGAVSKIPHETREVITKEQVSVKHKKKELTFNLVDTPGIATKIDYEDFLKYKLSKTKAKQRAKEATKGVIEAIKWLDDMDCVVVVLDGTQNPYSQVNITIIGNLAARDIPVMIVANKTDLKKHSIKKVEAAFPQYDVVGISAEKGKNMEEFYESIFRLVR